MRVLIDGLEVPEAEAGISIFDWGLQRGFGCFEVVRSYHGVPFRVAAHLDRLAGSAAALSIEVPARAALEEWVRAVARAGGDCQVRVLLTGGGRDPLVTAAGRAIVLWEPLAPSPDSLRLLPMEAPWHPATDRSPFYAVKWLSYAANMASADLARRRGFDDALLLTPEGLVLEGPTFSVAWVAGGHLETPALGLGILPSITRSVLLGEAAPRLGLAVVEGIFPLSRLLEADEALALSTVKEVTPLAAVGEHPIPQGEVTGRLGQAFRDIVAAETG
ncbi:MAG: aminotransferase class IV [Acidimicrobiia bacterium]|nr:aminotransferase class IV [Acidimicrobiia bacterium]